MKIRASRDRRDEVDLKFLLNECGVTSVAEATSLYVEFFPEDPWPDRALPMIRFALGQPES